MNRNIGIATAYGYALSKGYTGTEEEFAEQQAGIAQAAAAISGVISGKGQPNGYASLDENGRVPVSQLPPGGSTGGFGGPDLAAYTEITSLVLTQNGRRATDGRFDKDSAELCLGDLFFTPIGTDIVVTVRADNLTPILHGGSDYKEAADSDGVEAFTRHPGQDFVWFHCKTQTECIFILMRSAAGPLSYKELSAADPHLYIRFPSRVTNTLHAAVIRRKDDTANEYNRLFTVVHMTDVHGDMDSAHAMYDYADQIGADFMALTGDQVTVYGVHALGILDTLINNAKTPTVISLGNHDLAGLTEKGVYDRHIKQIADVLGASTVFSASGPFYYYRDFDCNGETVRAISLFPFSPSARVYGRGYYSAEQLQWLCETMASTPDGGHILILRHFPHKKPVPDSQASMFYDYSDPDTDLAHSWLLMNRDPVQDVVDAFNTRSVLSATYSAEMEGDTEGSPSGSVSVSYDFSNRSSAEFVAYLTGHVHRDHVGTVRGASTRQVVLGSICATGVSSTVNEACNRKENPRDYGTDSQIAFNVFAFDFEHKTIHVARVGNGQHNDTEKTWASVSYGGETA